MKKKIILGSFISLGIAIAFGALAAHGLKKILTPDLLNSFDTAVKYQIYNSIALLAVSGLKEKHVDLIKGALKLIIAGGIIFSLSIYLLVLFKHNQIDIASKIIGPITPVGGVLLVIGYFLSGFLVHSKLTSKL